MASLAPISSQIIFALSVLAIVLYYLPQLRLLRQVAPAASTENESKVLSNAAFPVYLIFPKENLSQAAQDSVTAQVRSETARDLVGMSGSSTENGIAFWIARLTPAQVTLFKKNPFVLCVMEDKPLFPAPPIFAPRDEWGNELPPGQPLPKYKPTKLQKALFDLYGRKPTPKKHSGTQAGPQVPDEASILEHGPIGIRRQQEYLRDKLQELSGLERRKKGEYPRSIHETVKVYSELHWDVESYRQVKPKDCLAQWTQDLVRRGLTAISPSDPNELVSIFDASSPTYDLNQDLRAFVAEQKVIVAAWEEKLKGKKIVVAEDYYPYDNRLVLFDDLPHDFKQMRFVDHTRFWTPETPTGFFYRKNRVTVRLNKFDIVQDISLK